MTQVILILDSVAEDSQGGLSDADRDEPENAARQSSSAAATSDLTASASQLLPNEKVKETVKRRMATITRKV